ncbi:hypothetical protein LK537_16330 [Lachnoclostridium pacaense]|uniref:hypothetical protein n=1 Tax=Enterocloster hominis (ex Hitch et al. 2024) TaxID=1917870 RepID=UPI001D0FD4CA|nr:hypothetical protein [Lachnoclostridium pacaense]MCC2818868.1 hypothetical protein [Lachnoclostridium pacaense]
MSLIGIDSTSYIPKDRIAKEGAGNFKNTFQIKYFYESIDNQLAYDSTCSHGKGGHGNYSGTENMYIYMFNAGYNVADNILTKYYLGKASVGDTAPVVNNSPFTFDSKSFKAFMSTKV